MAWFDFIRDVLFKLTPYLPGIVGVLIALSIAMILALLWLFRRARDRNRDGGDSDGGDSQRLLQEDTDDDAFAVEPDDIPLLPLKKGFKYALNILRTHVAGRDWRYAIPWYLLIGPEGSGKSTLAGATGLNMPVGAPAQDWEASSPACKWWFFDRGVVLDVAGNLVRLGDRRSSAAKGWRVLLSLLDRYRPRRPADGIILTVPIDDLIDRQGLPRQPEDVATRAEAVYKKLWQVQARLGLALPVYVLITKSDRLTGFKPYVQMLPEETRNGMLGWSSPYGIDTQFRKEWVSEAMSVIDRQLNDAQLELLAGGEPGSDLDEMFRLPEAFAVLGPNIGIYISKLFKPSAYHESFAMRGLYFTGDSGLGRSSGLDQASVLGGVYSGPQNAPPAPAFLHDLFDRKIFAERGLARPVKRALLARNRTALGAQIAAGAFAGIGALALWYSLGTIQDGVDTVEPFVKDVQEDLRELEAYRSQRWDRNGGAVGGSFDREKAINLLNGMTEVSVDSFSSVLIPSSLFFSYDDEIVDLTTEAFNKFILQSMQAALDERGRSIIAGRLSAADKAARSHQRFGSPPNAGAEGISLPAVPSVAGVLAAAGEGLAGSQTLPGGPAFQRMMQYVEALRRFESALLRYNTLRDSRDLTDIKALVRYLFGTQLPQDFLENATFYETALRSVRYQEIPPEAFSADARRRFETLAADAIRERFAENRLLVALREVGLALDDAANRYASGIGALVLLTERISEIEELLKAPENAWMDDPDYDPTSAFDPVLERIGGSVLLGPNLAARLDREVIDGVEDVRLELPDLRSLTLGPLLKRDGKNISLLLAEPVEDFHLLSLGLLAERFMAEGRDRPLPAAPVAGSGAGWNRDRLGEAIEFLSAYDNFMKERLDEAPVALHGLLRSAAAQRLEAVVNDRIAVALEGGPDGISSALSAARAGGALSGEERLGREVASIKTASPAFIAILEAYDTLGLEDSFIDLTDMVMSQALDLLDEADDLFATEQLYRPVGGDFSWWDGTPGMALDAFQATDPLHLREQLAVQHDRVRVLAENYIDPLIKLLASRDIRLADRDRRLVGKWRRILDELQKVALSKPENSVAVLERFIAGDLMKVGFSNCEEVLDGARLGDRGQNYFLARAAALREAVRQRCSDLAEIRAQTAYDEISDAFDAQLAGRYPFVRGPYRDGVRVASPREISRFFAIYDNRAKDAQNALVRAEGLGPEGELALDFLERMALVRSVFAPWLATGQETSAPAFDLAVTFRVNEGQEKGGNQVIDWQVSAGGQTVSNRDTANTLRWSLGDPIAVTLRWAENAIRRPAIAPDRPSLVVNGSSVRQNYEGSWALFDLVQQHRAGSEDFEGLLDPKPHTLRFRVPTRPTAGGAVEEALLFIRIEVSATAQGNTVPITIPVMPVSAPSLLGERG